MILPCIQACTEKEALNIGVFLNQLFTMISSWNDEVQLKQEVRSFNSTEPFELHKFQHIILTIFARMRGTLKSCLLSKEYVKAKNSLLILNQVIDVFPPIEEDAKPLKETIEKFDQNYPEREDLKKLGESYLINLKKKIELLPKVDRAELKKKATAKDKKPPASSNPNTSANPPNSSHSHKDHEESKSCMR